MKNKTLAEILESETKAQALNLNTSFLYNLAQNKIFTWILHRLKWPILSTFYICGISYFLWKEVLEYFPLFEWGDIFIYIQIFFAFGFILNAAIESLRSEIRGTNSHNIEALITLRDKRSFPILLVASVPFCWIGSTLIIKLASPSPYIGTYNLIILLLSMKLITQTYFRLVLSHLSANHRLPIKAYQWLIPTLMSFLWYHFSSHRPFDLVLALYIEWIFSIGMQLLRIQRFFPDESLNLLSKVKLKDSLRFFIKPIKRLPGTLPILALHTSLGAYFFQNKQIGPEALLLHAFTPLFALWVRSPSLFWKEFLKAESDSLERLLEAFSVLILSFVIFTSSDPFLITLITLFWCEVRFTKYWLNGKMQDFPIDAFIVCLALFSFSNPLLLFAGILLSFLGRLLSFLKISKEEPLISLSVRRSFWPAYRSKEALKELEMLGFSYHVDQHKILIQASTESLPTILNWGRGWIIEYKTLTSKKQTSPTDSIACFHLLFPFWKKSLPEKISLEDKALITRYLLKTHIDHRLSGKIRASGRTYYWRKTGPLIYLYCSNDGPIKDSLI